MKRMYGSRCIGYNTKCWNDWVVAYSSIQSGSVVHLSKEAENSSESPCSCMVSCCPPWKGVAAVLCTASLKCAHEHKGQLCWSLAAQLLSIFRLLSWQNFYMAKSLCVFLWNELTHVAYLQTCAWRTVTLKTPTAVLYSEKACMRERCIMAGERRTHFAGLR